MNTIVHHSSSYRCGYAYTSDIMYGTNIALEHAIEAGRVQEVPYRDFYRDVRNYRQIQAEDRAHGRPGIWRRRVLA